MRVNVCVCARARTCQSRLSILLLYSYVIEWFINESVVLRRKKTIQFWKQNESEVTLVVFGSFACWPKIIGNSNANKPERFPEY